MNTSLSWSHALYTNQLIRDFEQHLFKTKQANASQLMQTAGQEAFSILQRQWPRSRSILVFCGAGNNGGDGFVLAQIAHKNGYNVVIYSIKPVSQLTGLAQKMATACEVLNIPIHVWTNQAINFKPIDVIADALLGSGLQGNVKPIFKTAIQAINQSNCPTLAIDTPSGLNADTGAPQDIAVKAHSTITFIGQKQGLLTGDGPEYAGQLFMHTLDIPTSLYQHIKPSAYVVDKKTINELLKKRNRAAHKGCYGHVLVIGGDYGMAGAVRMAAESALRIGAGLVSVATHKEHGCIVNATCPEIMCHAVKTVKELQPLLAHASVVIVGPGLGQTEWSLNLLTSALKLEDKSILLDADALNLVAQHKALAQPLLKIKQLIITPHPGEAARLLNTSVKAIQYDRFSALTRLQKRYHATTVLKGAGTLIQQTGSLPIINTTGNPGMATAGMGDILSGMIGGLLAQGLTTMNAAQIGVYLHGKAADLALVKYGERSLLATDLLEFLPKAIDPSV